MPLAETLETLVDRVLSASNPSRPSGPGLPPRTGPERVEAAVLTATLLSAPQLTGRLDRGAALRVVRSFAECVERLVRGGGGEVTGREGDRITALFRGPTRCRDAARCALQVAWAVSHVLRPRLTEHLVRIGQPEVAMIHGVGVDEGSLLLAEDPVSNGRPPRWIGRAPPLAARLSEAREGLYASFLSAEVFEGLDETERRSRKAGRPLWERCAVGFRGESVSAVRSAWMWRP